MTAKIVVTIDGREAEVEAGATVLDAAVRLGIGIPTMCAVDGLPHAASCLVCTVADDTGRLLPACSTRAEAGMAITTTGAEVVVARRTNLELLLSEHAGDCEGPCRVICAAGMDIPDMMYAVAAGDFTSAAAIVKAHIPFPSILGRICPAPCEKGCRSSRIDQPLAIRGLERWLGDLEHERDGEGAREPGPATGHRVAVVGAGPAGLSAANFLLLQGHECTVFDAHAEVGGGLRYGIEESKLPNRIVDADTAVVKRLGCRFRLGTRIAGAAAWRDLRRTFDAVVLACGESARDDLEGLGVELCRLGVAVENTNLKTSLDGVFAGGGAVRPGRIAVRSVAQGRTMATAVDQYLGTRPAVGTQRAFNSWLGRITDAERDVLAAGRNLPRLDEKPSVRDEGSARSEAQRCLHCECLKRHDCRLRSLSEEYGADQRRFRARNRCELEIVDEHETVVFEPGKCIRCGVCVRLTEHEQEPLGMTFVGRGAGIRVGVPLGRSLGEGLTHSARACAAKCPTAALALKRMEE